MENAAKQVKELGLSIIGGVSEMEIAVEVAAYPSNRAFTADEIAGLERIAVNAGRSLDLIRRNTYAIIH